MVHNQWFYASGVYTETFQSYRGCDSTSTVDLLINASQNISSAISACDSALVHGVWEYSSGEYTETFQSFTGCDSTSVVTLSLSSSVSTVDEMIACDSALVHGAWVYDSGDIEQTFTSETGCDSTSTVALTLVPSPQTPPALPQDTVLFEEAMYEIDLAQNAGSPISWDPPGAVDCDTCRSVSIDPSFAGRLRLQQGVAPCLLEREIDITRQPRPVNDRWQTPDAFSPNGDGINDFF